jgi:hypothetical protein
MRNDQDENNKDDTIEGFGFSTSASCVFTLLLLFCAVKLYLLKKATDP